MKELSKILIVDDQSENLIFLEMLLERIEVEILASMSGEKALQLIQCHEFSLIILDVDMPRMNGYKLAELIRKQEATQSTPLMFISSEYFSEAHIFQGYELGAVDFLIKPLTPKILWNKVRTFVELDQQKKKLKGKNMQLEQYNQELFQVQKSLEQELEQGETKRGKLISQLSELILKKADIAQFQAELVRNLAELRSENRNLNQQLTLNIQALARANATIERFLQEES